jgi:hypothetical protein
MELSLIRKCLICPIIFVAFIFPLLSLSHAQSQVITLVGEINETGQLSAEGDFF